MSSSPDRSVGESIPVFSPGSCQEGIPFLSAFAESEARGRGGCQILLPSQEARSGPRDTAFSGGPVENMFFHSSRTCPFSSSGWQKSFGSQVCGPIPDHSPGNQRSERQRIDNYKYTVYDTTMIKTFRHKGIERYFLRGSKAGIQASHERRLRLQLTRLDGARNPEDMNAPGWKLHPLKGNLQGVWAVWVDGNFRLIFRFKGEDVYDVDYRDYH